jgi:DcuC family C4-dicarboxylate transporter
MTLLLALGIIAVAVYAVLRQVDVRLALLSAALALGALAGDPIAVVRKFLTTLSQEQFVVPICCAMGFAYVLRHTQCDQHLVHLLVEPLRRVRVLLIPGAVLVGFLVNSTIISQTSTAVAVGFVLVPLLLAARISPLTAGAALLLGSSLGGELLNPGAPELRTITEVMRSKVNEDFSSSDCVELVAPLLLLQLGVATTVFWIISVRAEARLRREETAESPAESDAQETPPFSVNLLKALVPVLPLALLFLTGPAFRQFEWLQVPKPWLVEDLSSPQAASQFDSRLIGAAMLVGVAVASLVAWRSILGVAKAFFQGAGYAFTNIISLIVIANCFGEGVKQIGLAAYIGETIKSWPRLLAPTAGMLPLMFAWISGSGMASTQSLYQFFVGPAQELNFDPARIGAVVAIGAAAGRTMSPVAAVTLMCAAMTNTNPLDLIRRIAPPLLLGMVAVIAAGAMLAR